MRLTVELSCPAEAGTLPLIVAQPGGPHALPYAPARRVSFSELLDSSNCGKVDAGIDRPQVRGSHNYGCPALECEDVICHD